MHGNHQAIDYLDQKCLGRQKLYEKFRFQLPVLLASTATLQFCLNFALYGSPELPIHASNALALTFIANLIGLMSYRRLRLYPGARRSAFVIPSFALGWTSIATFLLLSRIPYSLIQLSVGFAAAVSLMLLISALGRRPDMRPLLLLPSPRVDALLTELPELASTTCVDPHELVQSESAIVADLHADLPREWEQSLARAALKGVTIYHVKQISESLTGKVQVEHLSENAFGTLAPNGSYAFAKNVAERILSALLLVILAPLLMLVSIAVRLDSAGPAIFKQERVGYRGESFTIYKFRTMASKKMGASLEDDMTKLHDPRVTRVGKRLRELRIDEIPQLFNVLIGDMSVIGPRPETVNLSKWYGETLDFYPYRHVVLPGITGWAQVKQGHVTSVESVLEKLQYDFYYIKHFSLWLDVLIVLKTFGVMMKKIGAR